MVTVNTWKCLPHGYHQRLRVTKFGYRVENHSVTIMVEIQWLRVTDSGFLMWVVAPTAADFFPQGEPQQIGDRQKAFSEDNRFLLVWDVSSVVIKEKQ